MDMWQIIRIIVRRWYLFLPVFALGIGVAFVTTAGATAQYTAAVDAFVSAPASRASQPAGSVENSGGVGFAGSLEQSAMDSDEIRKKIHAMGLLPDYEVTWTRAQLKLTVVAIGPVPDVARRTVEQIVTEANQHLAAYQTRSGVTLPAAQYTIQPSATGANLSPPTFPGQTRQRILIGVVALVLAIGIAVTVDGLLASRSQSKKAGASPGVAARNPYAPTPADPAYVDPSHLKIRPTPPSARPLLPEADPESTQTNIRPITPPPTRDDLPYVDRRPTDHRGTAIPSRQPDSGRIPTRDAGSPERKTPASRPASGVGSSSAASDPLHRKDRQT